MSSVDVHVLDRVRLDRVERHHVALTGVMLVGLVLRAGGLGAESLWWDEVFLVEALHLGGRC